MSGWYFPRCALPFSSWRRRTIPLAVWGTHIITIPRVYFGRRILLELTNGEIYFSNSQLELKNVLYLFKHSFRKWINLMAYAELAKNQPQKCHTSALSEGFLSCYIYLFRFSIQIQVQIKLEYPVTTFALRVGFFIFPRPLESGPSVENVELA